MVQAGKNEFALSIITAGIYSVTAITKQGTICYKVICTDASESVNKIQYLGTGSSKHSHQNDQNNSFQPGLKTSQTGYTLGYASGEIILFKCYRGIYTTVVTDSPVESKNYEVEFAACTDPDGKNYSIVKIGEQTWMAENLAYLRSVVPSSEGSDITSYYYVYGYEGRSIISAKATANFASYGVLYNWVAAKYACPSGWYLPSDEEWKTLEQVLDMSESDANTEGLRFSGAVGGKLKDIGTTQWASPNAGAKNTAGFTALPGGTRTFGDGFIDIGNYANLWASSETGLTGAWVRGVSSDNDGIWRYPIDRRLGFSVRCLKDNVCTEADTGRNGTLR